MRNAIKKYHKRKQKIWHNIPLQSSELDQIQYYDFVKNKKHDSIINFIFDNKIEKVHIINIWFDKRVEDKENQALIIIFIEDQIESCEKM